MTLYELREFTQNVLVSISLSDAEVSEYRLKDMSPKVVVWTSGRKIAEGWGYVDEPPYFRVDQSQPALANALRQRGAHVRMSL